MTLNLSIFFVLSQASQLARKRALAASSEPNSGAASEDPLANYCRELILGELTQRLFALTQRIHKKLPEQVSQSIKGCSIESFCLTALLIRPPFHFVKASVNLFPVSIQC